MPREAMNPNKNATPTVTIKPLRSLRRMVTSIGRKTGESRASLRESSKHSTEDATLSQVLIQQPRGSSADDPTNTAATNDSREQIELRGKGAQGRGRHDSRQCLMRSQAFVFQPMTHRS